VSSSKGESSQGPTRRDKDISIEDKNCFHVCQQSNAIRFIAPYLPTKGATPRSLISKHGKSGEFSRPDPAIAYAPLGEALLSQRRMDEAVIYYRQSLEIDRNYASGHTNLENSL
jgi:tetratricopeptide (TPR) repeat protein